MPISFLLEGRTTADSVSLSVRQTRVSLFARAFFLIAGLGLILRLALPTALGGDFDLSGASLIWQTLGLVPFGLLALIMARRTCSDRFVVVAEWIAIWATTIAHVAMGALENPFAIPHFAVLMVLTIIYLIRAAYVPTTGLRALFVTAGAILPMLIIPLLVENTPLVIDGTAIDVTTTTGKFISTCAWWSLICIAAYAIARTTHGLRREVAAARRLGQYTLGEKIGGGGMGEVYRATHARLQRPTAIKLVHPDTVKGPVALARFELEAQETALLTSPHTIELYDFGQSNDGTVYYVMELLDGLDLRCFVEQYGPAPAERVVHWLLQTCHSLAEAHARRLVHRDIKPANILLSRRGLDVDVVKVLDFGLVKRHTAPGEESLHFTNLGSVGGTPAYLAPEQALGDVVLDGRTDLYGLGCVAYLALTGQDVFVETTTTRLLLAHANTVPIPPSQRSEMPIPQALDDIIMSCLAKAPADRPADANALAAALTAISLETQWTTERAQRWWQTHQPATPSI